MASLNNTALLFKTLALSSILVLCFFLIEGSHGLNLSDEGFLWYGVQRVLHGEIPIRDFMAYEPGRYYWSALILKIAGDDGIIALRVAISIFAVLGLWAGLYLLAASEQRVSIIFLLLAGITFTFWMVPRHKLFDISLSLLSMSGVAYLLSKPNKGRHFRAGLFVGLTCLFGRNHGLYASAASIGALAYLLFSKEYRLNWKIFLSFWITGFTVGLLPLFLMAVFIPGFFHALWSTVKFIWEFKHTNLPLPVPWPWKINWDPITFRENLRNFMVGGYFILLILFGVVSLLWIYIRRWRGNDLRSPAFISAALFTLPYAHFAYSRADISHLAQGIFPVLLGIQLLIMSGKRWQRFALQTAFCGISIFTIITVHPAWTCLIQKKCAPMQINNDELQVTPKLANEISVLRAIKTEFAPSDKILLVTPFWPGAYALFRQRSPMWEIYALFPRTKEFEEKEIMRIKEAQPNAVLVQDIALDGRDELRFTNTHPRIFSYIKNHYSYLKEVLPGIHLYVYDETPIQ